MRILIAEDELELAAALEAMLKREHYSVDVVHDGDDALDYGLAENYDGLVLDIMMPKMDGLEAVRRMRERGTDTPVLFLTARDAIEDRVGGLNAGADDYLVKPFAFDEFCARVRALLRRNAEGKSPILTLADLTLNTLSREVTRGGRRISLTSTEYALLVYLLRNQSHVLTRSQITDHVWNYDFDYDSNVVDVYIRYLRNKIDRDFACKLIHTVRGAGYVMRVEEG